MKLDITSDDVSFAIATLIGEYIESSDYEAFYINTGENRVTKIFIADEEIKMEVYTEDDEEILSLTEAEAKCNCGCECAECEGKGEIID